MNLRALLRQANQTLGAIVAFADEPSEDNLFAVDFTRNQFADVIAMCDPAEGAHLLAVKDVQHALSLLGVTMLRAQRPTGVREDLRDWVSERFADPAVPAGEVWLALHVATCLFFPQEVLPELPPHLLESEVAHELVGYAVARQTLHVDTALSDAFAVCLPRYLAAVRDFCDAHPFTARSAALLDAVAETYDATTLTGTACDMRPSFDLHYDLMERMLRLQNRWEPFVPPPPRPAGQRIKACVLMLNCRPNTESFFARGMLKHLDREIFDLHLVCAQPIGETAFETAFTGMFSSAHSISGMPLDKIIDVMRRESYDLLLLHRVNHVNFTDTIGQITAQRVARKQVLYAPISPFTAMPSFDLAISSELADPEGTTAAEIGVPMVRIPGTASVFDLGGATVRQRQLGFRAALGLADDDVLLVSGGHVSKIGPEILDAWLDVMARHPRVSMALYPFNPYWGTHGRLVSQLQRGAFWAYWRAKAAERGIAAERLFLFDSLSREEVADIVGAADIFVDTFPYTSGASLLEPLLLGKPVITVEGEPMRSHLAATILRSVGLGGMVFADLAAYRDALDALLADPARRAAAAAAVAGAMRGTPALFDAAAYAERVTPILVELVDRDRIPAGEAAAAAAR